MTKIHTTSTETVRYEITGGGHRDPYTFHLNAEEFARFEALATSGELDGETYGHGRITATRLNRDCDQYDGNFWYRTVIWII